MPFFKKRWLLDERGMSLPLVLTVTATTLMASVAVLQVSQNMKKSAESAVSKSEVDVLVEQINSILQNEASCRNAIGGPAVYGGALDSKAQNFNPSPGVVNPIKLYKPSSADVFIADPSLGMPDKAMFGRNKITKLQIVPIDTVATDLYRSKLVLEVERPSETFGQSTTKNQQIRISVRVSGGKIASCTSVFFKGTDAQPLAVPQCDSGDYLYSNGNVIRCSKRNCPRHDGLGGNHFRGYGRDGNPVCSQFAVDY